MNQEPLLSTYQAMKGTKQKNSVAWQFLATFALGATIAYMGSPSAYFSEVKENVNLWMNQAKAEYNWNVTSILSWSAVATFINVAVSPTGDLYGIQSYNDGRSVVQYAYKFNFISGQWQIIDPTFSVSDIKFDKIGNIYFLDKLGNVVTNQNKALPILTNVKDFEVTVAKNIYAVSTTTGYSTNAYTQAFDSTGYGQGYKMFPVTQYNRIALVNDVPIYVGRDNKTVGYGNQCVVDITVGVDGAVWALACGEDNAGNYQIIKWDPFLGQWYLVKGKTGIKIAAYNEISAAVLTTDGLIYVSSDTGDTQPAQYLVRAQNSLSLYTNSTLVTTQAAREWLKNQLPQYGQSSLLYRATIHGWDAGIWQGLTKNQGPTLTIVKSQYGRTFGAFIANNFTLSGSWANDPSAFIFQLDNLVRANLKNPSETYTYLSHSSYTLVMGQGNDILMTGGSGQTPPASSSCQTAFGYSFNPPAGVAYNAASGQTYLHGSPTNYFAPVEMETWALTALNNGQLY